MLNKQDLVEYLESGCTPKEQWRIGLEHEQFAYATKDGSTIAYDGSSGIRAILESFISHYGWSGKYEGENLIALSKDKKSITLEPAGQVELSGAPYKSIEDVVNEHTAFITQLQAIGENLGISFMSKGVHPNWSRADMNWMPKARYDIMRPYMLERGTHGVDMMTRTCGSQVNLDFDSEADMVRKFRVTMGLQPFMVSFFANSQIMEGKNTGYASMRAHIWDNTDADRCGVLPFVFEDSMSFERYVDYMLNVPMYFIMRDGQMINMAGKPFRKFLEGTLPENQHYEATLQDWEDHLSTAFPEVRLKKYIELRGTDSVDAPLLYALPAFWVGLLYDESALAEAESLIAKWKPEDHIKFRKDVAKDGFCSFVPNTQNMKVADMALQLVSLAEMGLKRQPQQSGAVQYLEDLRQHISKFESCDRLIA